MSEDTSLETWAAGQAPLEAVDREPLSELLLAARRASAQRMSEAELARMRARLRARTPPRRARAAWLAATAASLAMAALVGWPRASAPPARVVVKQVLFESVRAGKTVRLEMTLYREAPQEKRHAPKPTM